MRPSILASTALMGAVALCAANPVLAQAGGPTAGLRYLTWSGKPQTPQTGAVAAAQPAYSRPAPTSNPTARYPGMASQGRPSRYSPSVSSGALTPASAWMNPAANVAPAPTPYAAAPAPAYAAAPPPAPYADAPRGPAQMQPAPMQAAAPPPAWAQPGYAPRVYAAPQPQPQMQAQSQMQGQNQIQPQSQMQAQHEAQAQYEARAQAEYQAQVQSQFAPRTQPDTPPWPGMAPAPATVPVMDPMAPRRDAAIFRIPGGAQVQTAGQNQNLGQPQEQAQAQSQTPQPQTPQAHPAGGREGARFYSVHRAAGLQPDPTVLPEVVYLDAAPVDLAAPPPAPITTRTINGRAQVMNQSDNPSLP